MKLALPLSCCFLGLSVSSACSSSESPLGTEHSSGGQETLNATGGDDALGATGTGSTKGSDSDAGSGGIAQTGTGGADRLAPACPANNQLKDEVTQTEPYDAPPETLAQAGVPQGTLSGTALFPSALYGDEFPYRVYVPAQYSPESPAALMVFQDGGLYIDQFKAPIVFDQLISAGEMPPTIALFLDAPAGGEAKRVEVYDNPSALYSRFLVEEIIPSVITTDYTISNNPDLWATGGFSAGGIQAFAALLYQPDSFHKSVGQNSSFLAAKANGTDFTVSLAALEPAHRFKVSLLSSPHDLSDQRGEWLAGNRDMANALSANGHDVRFAQGTGGHYPPLQGIADFPNALRWLWSGCSLK